MLRDNRPVVRSDEFVAGAMRAHGAAVLRLALVQTGSRADAEDVCQDVFMRLAQDATSFASEEHLRAWLLRVTANRCHDLGRAPWRRCSVSLDALAKVRGDAADPSRRPEPGDACDEVGAGPAGTDPARVVERRAEATALWRAVRSLPAHYREVVHLFYEEEMSCEEIAETLHARPSTVRTRLQRARDQLRTLMGGFR